VDTVVHLRLFSPFDRLCGMQRVTVEFPCPPTLRDVLLRFVDRYPALGKYLLKRTGSGSADFEDYFLACVGEEIMLLEDMIPDGAEVKLFAPHAGG